MSGYEKLRKINKVLWRVFVVSFVVFLINYFFEIHWVIGSASLLVLVIGSFFATLFLVEYIWSFFDKK